VTDPVRRIADAVLYEGYILWPYRRSALKNQRRWTFGGIYPPAHSASHPDDPCERQAEVLVEGASGGRVEIAARFLQVVERRIKRGTAFLDEAVVGGERHLAWDEAVERAVSGVARLGELPERFAIDLPAGESEEPLGDGASFVRCWSSLRGTLECRTAPAGEGSFRLTVRLRNETRWSGGDRGDAQRHTMCSAHVVLHTQEGAFVSATESDCANEGLWPVLVGETGARDTMLAAPIILSDYPQIAPESPGDLFDATEIDQLLILNVLALTPAEQAEMRASDPRAREILDRCAALSPEELMRLHGAIREFRPVAMG
jgi:hypothetical protein